MTPGDPFIGVLMLDTAFPRILGDAGNVASYDVPVSIVRVQGAGALTVVRAEGPAPEITDKFINAAQTCVAQGAVGLVSTCGFLVHSQNQIANSVSVPVMVSALSLYPSLRLAFGRKPIGILTSSGSKLSQGTLQAAGIPASDVRVAGMDRCPAFTAAILAEKSAQPDTLDSASIAAFCTQQVQQMVAEDPDIGCILLECGNLPPYAAAIRAAAQRPVFSILDAAQLLWRGAETV